MPMNRDAAASIGIPAAVDAHPGYTQHLNEMKQGRSNGMNRNAKRNGNRGLRTGRRARSIG